MARTRRQSTTKNISTEKTSIVSSPDKPLTPEEVWDVLQFAAKAYGGVYGYPNAYTPELVSARLKDVSLSPAQATKEKIEAALNTPKESENLLVGYSEFFEINSMLYKRIIRYLSGMLSWNLSYVCTNATEADYKTDKYKKDLAIVRDFFDKMNIKHEFSTALKEMVRKEVFFSYFRDDGNSYVFQELNRNYCLITARSDIAGGILLFDFSTLWFLQAGVDINMFPPIFKRFYDETLRNGGQSNIFYDPATSVDSRNSHWVYWHQTSPDDGFFAFKLSPELATQVPMMAPLFPDLINQPIVRTLQNNSYIQMASKIITSQIPYLNKDVKGPTGKDNVAISPKLLGEFLNILRQGLSQTISVATLPTEEIGGVEFQGDTTIYDSYLQSTASLSGINSRLIYTSQRQNVLETEYSTDVDKMLIRPVYSPFEGFLNYQINKKTKRFKFKFTLSGTEFGKEKKETLEKATSLANLGIVLPQMFANALNMNPFDFERALEEARANGFAEKLTPIVSGFQQSGKNSSAGRPSKNDSELSDSGGDTKASGANEEKSI